MSITITSVNILFQNMESHWIFKSEHISFKIFMTACTVYINFVKYSLKSPYIPVKYQNLYASLKYSIFIYQLEMKDCACWLNTPILYNVKYQLNIQNCAYKSVSSCILIHIYTCTMLILSSFFFLSCVWDHTKRGKSNSMVRM